MATICFDGVDPASRDDLTLEKSPPKAPFWTDVKIKRVWLAAAAALCAIGSVVLGVLGLTITPWFLAGAIPLALACGTLVWYASCYLIDYDNPKELARVQDKAAKISLDKIVAKHGWDRLFQYSIVKPEQFNHLYCQHVQGMKLNQVMSYYEETRARLMEADRKAPQRDARHFEVPEVKNWKGLLVQETKGLQYELLTREFSLQRLVDYSLITPDELTQSFIRFADQAPLNTVIAEYEKASDAVMGKDGFTLPKPVQWKAKLAQETNNFTYMELTRNHSVSKLIRYSLLDSQTLIQSFTNFAEKASLSQVISEYEKTSAEVQGCAGFALPKPIQWIDKLAPETNGLQYQKIMAQYSLPKLILYSLIQPHQLRESFSQYAETAPLIHIVDEFEKTTRQIASFPLYTLPSPFGWKDKFYQETAAQSAASISAKYPLSDLLRHGIIGENEHRILFQAVTARDQFATAKRQCEQEASRRKDAEWFSFQQTKENAERTYEANLAHGQLRNLYSEYLNSIAFAESQANTQMEAERAHLANYETMQPENIESLRAQCAANCALIQGRLDTERAFYYTQYLMKEADLKRAVQEAEYLRDESIGLAKRQYDSAVDSANRSAESQISLHKKALEHRLIEIDREYDRFRQP